MLLCNDEVRHVLCLFRCWTTMVIQITHAYTGLESMVPRWKTKHIPMVHPSPISSWRFIISGDLIWSSSSKLKLQIGPFFLQWFSRFDVKGLKSIPWMLKLLISAFRCCEDTWSVIEQFQTIEQETTGGAIDNSPGMKFFWCSEVLKLIKNEHV